MDVVIRMSTIDDYGAVLRIGTPVHMMHARAMPNRIREDAVAFPIERFRGMLEMPDATVLMAVRNGEVVGFETLRIEQSPPIPMLVSHRTAIMDLPFGRNDAHPAAHNPSSLLSRSNDIRSSSPLCFGAPKDLHTGRDRSACVQRD